MAEQRDHVPSKFRNNGGREDRRELRELRELFSVVQFFEDGSYEYVRKHVPSDEAIKAFKHYTSSVAVAMRFVVRVIITDSDDFIAAEWLIDKGIVFPVPPAGGEQAS